MSKNDTLAAVVTALESAIPEVEWTRRALFPEQVANWPTGCVVSTEWRASGDVGAPRIWEGTILIRVYAQADGTANEDMVDVLDRLEATLDNAAIDGAAVMQITGASIDQDELQSMRCQLDATFTLTI